jgi:predicted enzyme related to lactoylglutathione lyase
VVAHESVSPAWLPYVEVSDICAATERARRLGAELTLPPREGPAGWRSVLSAPAGGEVALWQPKT